MGGKRCLGGTLGTRPADPKTIELVFKNQDSISILKNNRDTLNTEEREGSN